MPGRLPAVFVPLLRHSLPILHPDPRRRFFPARCARRLLPSHPDNPRAAPPLSRSGRSPDSSGRGTLADRTRYRKSPVRKIRRDYSPLDRFRDPLPGTPGRRAVKPAFGALAYPCSAAISDGAFCWVPPIARSTGLQAGPTASFRPTFYTGKAMLSQHVDHAKPGPVNRANKTGILTYSFEPFAIFIMGNVWAVSLPPRLCHPCRKSRNPPFCAA